MKSAHPDPPDDLKDNLQTSEFCQEPPRIQRGGRVSPFTLTSVQVISRPVQNINIAADKSNDGGDAGHDLQFGFVCSQANTIGKDQDAAPISTTIMSRMRQNPRWRIEGLVDKIC